MKIKKFKIFESPDSVDCIKHTYNELQWWSNDAHSFGYDENGQMLVSKVGSTHSFMGGRINTTFPGRIWIESKLISFWQYPKDYTELKIVLNDLEEKFNKHDHFVNILESYIPWTNNNNSDFIDYSDDNFDEKWGNINITDNWDIEVIVINNEQALPKTKFWGSSVLSGDDEEEIDLVSKIIKVGDYMGSEKRSAKELAMAHIKIGSGNNVPKGFGSKSYDDKLPKNMTDAEYKNKKTKYKYTENMKNVKNFKLFESPDKIVDLENDVNLLWRDHNAVVFGYSDYERDKPKLYLSYNEEVTHSMLDPRQEGRDEMNYAGRLWLKYKYISFWDYPEDKKKLVKIMKAIERRLKKVYDIKMKFKEDKWRVEIVVDEDGDKVLPDTKRWDDTLASTRIKRIDSNDQTERDSNNDTIWTDGTREKRTTEFILVKDYDGSLERSEEEKKIDHLVVPIEKEKEKQRKIDAGEDVIPKGFGAKYYKDRLSKDVTPAQYIDTVTKYKYTESASNNYKIYLDMDGVITDFDGQYNKLFLDDFNEENDTNVKDGWEFEEIYGTKEMWKSINELGIDFWENMPWTKDGKELWNFLKKYDVEILSKPSKDKMSRIGKKNWCDKNLPDIKLNLSTKKEEYAKTNCILIDDLKKNIDAWKNADGIGILHKNTKDTIEKLKKLL